MKVFICADIEGIGCVTRHEHTRPGQREYERARIWMTREVNAAVEAAFANGATDVLVADSHNVGVNLLPEMLHPKTRLIMGGPRPLSMMEGIQEGFDAVFFVGTHAMSATADATIPHIFSGRVQQLRLNGVSVGELGLNAALAGYYDAPVALVAGDEAACAEAEALLPGVETVAVKQGIGSYAVLTPMPEKCQELVRSAAENAMRRSSPPPIWQIQGTVRLEVQFSTASGADRALRVPRTERVDALTVAYDAEDVLEAFQAFNTMADLLELIPFI